MRLRIQLRTVVCVVLVSGVILAALANVFTGRRALSLFDKVLTIVVLGSLFILAIVAAPLFVVGRLTIEDYKRRYKDGRFRPVPRTAQPVVELVEPESVTADELSILRAVGRSALPMTLGVICFCLGAHNRWRVAALVDDLIERQLLTCRAAADRRRSYHLTATGRAVLERIDQLA